MEQRTATIDGTPVRWYERGAGTPVVLVHGIPTSPALWRHVVPLLTGVRVLALARIHRPSLIDDGMPNTQMPSYLGR